MGRFRKLAAAVAVTALVASGGAVLLSESPASAAKVANPGSGFVLKVQQGLLRIKTQNFDFNDETRLPQCSDGNNNDEGQDTAVDFPSDPDCSSAADDSEVASGLQPKQPIQLTGGTINANGTFTFTNISFPRQYLWVADAPIVGSFQVNIDIVQLSQPTGTIDANTGAMTLNMSVQVNASGGPLNGGCKVGPINVNGLTTGTTNPPGPNTPITGVPYNPATGRMTLVQNSYSVPGASGCTATFLSVDVNGQINDQLGLPSDPGNNEASFLGEFTQAGADPQPAVTASFTTSPSSGTAPLNVSVDGSASTGAGRTYLWDWTNDGTFDTGSSGIAVGTHLFGQAGTYTIRLRVTDSGGDFAETTRLVTVGANLPPVANDQSVSTPEDTAKAITVTATDPELGAITYARTTPNPAHGTATCNAAGACTYTPNANYNGPDSFGFRATDNFSPPNTDDGVVSVNVTAVNDTPTSANVSATIVEDTPGAVNLSANDLDGDALTYNVIAGPTKGALSGSGSSLTYTPNPNAIGADSFTYDVNDGSGAHSNVSTASITISAVNDAPVADAQSVTTNEDTPVAITLTGSDVDGDTLTYGFVSLPTQGSVSGSLPNITYTPVANSNGTDSLTFKVTDPSGATSSAVVPITITPVNDAPTAVDASVGTTQDNPITVNVVANDLDGDALTYTPTQGANGTVSCTDNACTYTPDSGFAGTDAFEVTVADPSNATAVSHITVNVSALNNHAPVINDSTVAVLEDTGRTFTLSSTDPDGNPRTYSVLVNPASGTLSCSTGGSCTYTPAANVNGNQTFVIQVSDGVGGIDNATVTLAIAAINDAPVVPGGQAVVTAEDNVATYQALGSDVDGDTVTWTIKRAPTKGTLACTGGGLCTYTPNHNVNGADSYDIEAADGNGAKVRTTVGITITPVDDPAVAGAVTKVVVEDSGASSFSLIGSDPDGGSVSFAASPATSGLLTCGAGGTCTFTPAANAIGTETVGYTVTDSGGTATGTITLTISPVNDAPVAGSLTLSTPEDTAIDLTLPASDLDTGDPLTYTYTSAPLTGRLSGTLPNVTFTPATNASGVVTFGFQVRDLAGATSNGTVTITVFPVNDLPVAGSAAVTTPEDTAKAITLTGSDAEGPVTISITSGPSHGTYTIGGGVYTPAVNYSGPDAIGFSVKDNSNQTTAGTISITVVPVNDPPVATDASVSTTRTVPVAITLGGTDVDGPGTITYAVTSPPTKGTLSGTAPNLTYTPTGFNTGADALTFTVTDGAGLVDSGTVNITINAGPALPTKQVASPATVTKPGGLLGFLMQYSYANLKSTVTTVGTNLPVSGVTVTFSVAGTTICSATTNASGVATCNGSGPRVDSPTYTATSTANAGFAASTATGTLS